MSRPSAYLHGTSAPEQARLALLNRLVNRGSLAELRLARRARILEVGSGLGDFARAMARRVGPSGRVLGVERSARQLRAARRAAKPARGADLEFRRGDALDLPLRAGEWEAFDLVHARFLLEHLDRPLAAVEQMVRAARPGGRIVLEDDDHDVLRLHPSPRRFVALWRAYMRSFRVLGNDPLIGRKLPALLVAAGATPVRNTWIFFGSCAGHPRFALFLENLYGVVATARATLLSHRLISSQGYRDGLEDLRRWGERPGAALFYAIAWAEGRRPR
jgi:SAM-dependent methyltransferase